VAASSFGHAHTGHFISIPPQSSAMHSCFHKYTSKVLQGDQNVTALTHTHTHARLTSDSEAQFEQVPLALMMNKHYEVLADKIWEFVPPGPIVIPTPLKM
jgi:hypothetical protein